MSESAQYAPARNVPLIKSPSLRVPRQVQLPPDIHPLPESVEAYFVYPFTLEPHILTLESSRRSTLAAHDARHAAVIQEREDLKDRRKKEALRRVAPGFGGDGGVLVPTQVKNRSSMTLAASPDTSLTSGHTRTKSVMEDLVDQLAQLDAGSSATTVNRPTSQVGILPSPPPPPPTYQYL